MQVSFPKEIIGTFCSKVCTFKVVHHICSQTTQKFPLIAPLTYFLIFLVLWKVNACIYCVEIWLSVGEKKHMCTSIFFNRVFAFQNSTHS